MKIGIVGSGNVGSHLARALKSSGCEIIAVASARQENANRLAGEVGAVSSTVSDFPVDDYDVVIIAVSDSAVADVAAQLPQGRAIVAHTSGSIPLHTLSERHPRSGVFYPLQTFSREVAVDIAKVPFFIEGDSRASVDVLKILAHMLSVHVFEADSSVRARLHIAGVLTSNFPIYLLEMAREVLGDVPLSVVEPLAFASLQKAFDVGPLKALTGPARRGDIAVVERQSSAIKDKLQRRIYDDLSAAILATFHPGVNFKIERHE